MKYAILIELSEEERRDGYRCLSDMTNAFVGRDWITIFHVREKIRHHKQWSAEQSREFVRELLEIREVVEPLSKPDYWTRGFKPNTSQAEVAAGYARAYEKSMVGLDDLVSKFRSMPALIAEMSWVFEDGVVR